MRHLESCVQISATRRHTMSSTMAGDQSSGSTFRTPDANDMNAILVRNWWLFALRGLVGVSFGLVALILPFATILALVLLFSAYMIVDGMFSIAAAVGAGMIAGACWLCRVSPASRQAFSPFSGPRSPSLHSCCSLRRGRS
jgi:hypothetical protein